MSRSPRPRGGAGGRVRCVRERQNRCRGGTGGCAHRHHGAHCLAGPAAPGRDAAGVGLCAPTRSRGGCGTCRKPTGRAGAQTRHSPCHLRLRMKSLLHALSWRAAHWQWRPWRPGQPPSRHPLPALRLPGAMPSSPLLPFSSPFLSLHNLQLRGFGFDRFGVFEFCENRLSITQKCHHAGQIFRLLLKISVVTLQVEINSISEASAHTL